VEYIAQRQDQLIRNAMAKESPALIADTEMLVCKIWSEFVFGYCPDSIVQLTEKQEFDYYLLCDIDLPWEPDPLREHPEHRAELLDLFKAELAKRNWPYTLVRGTGNQRLQNAIHEVNKVLGIKD
jgi:nicotinamide riboside kinase